MTFRRSCYDWNDAFVIRDLKIGLGIAQYLHFIQVILRNYKSWCPAIFVRGLKIDLGTNQ